MFNIFRWLWCISSIRPQSFTNYSLNYMYIYNIIDIHLDPPSIQNMQISSSFHITSLPSRFTRRATTWLACGISWPLDGWTLSLVWYLIVLHGIVSARQGDLLRDDKWLVTSRTIVKVLSWSIGLYQIPMTKKLHDTSQWFEYPNWSAKGYLVVSLY